MSIEMMSEMQVDGMIDMYRLTSRSINFGHCTKFSISLANRTSKLLLN